MSDLAIEKLKSLVDPSQLIVSLGFSVFYDNDIEIRGSCCIHGGDNKTAFCFRKSTNRFYCYTHGCHLDVDGTVNNDIVSLVMKVRKCSFAGAVDYLCSLTGFDISSAVVDSKRVKEYKNKKDKDKFVKGVLNNNTLPTIPESLVKEFVNNGSDYFRSIGIPDVVVEFFELGTMVDDMGIIRGSIPIRDDKGRLVSISGRRVDGNDEPRYLLIKEFKKRKVLYNLHVAKKFRDVYNKTVVIVEGFKALWHVYMCGYKNVVAVMGRVINPEQVNLLVKHGFNSCLLMFDGDEPGISGIEKSLLLMKNKIEVNPIYLPQELSPDDISISDLNDLISTFMV